ncbi:tetratricopeptide repeat protein [Clostridium sp.]|uniref:tetratricopeptide repeat protein n=1 Tax=Clostridium sp. TaxID=1506 RepID=UPI003F4C5F60
MSYTKLGYELYKERNFIESLKYFEKAIELEESGEWLCRDMYFAGLVSCILKRYDDALEYYDMAINTRRDYYPPYVEKISILYQLKEYEDVIYYSEQSISDPIINEQLDDYSIYLMYERRADSYYKLMKWNESLKPYVEFFNRLPETAENYYDKMQRSLNHFGSILNGTKTKDDSLWDAYWHYFYKAQSARETKK